MEEVLKTDKEVVYDKLLQLLASDCFLFTRKASESIDLDSGWTQKAVIEGIKLYAGLHEPLYYTESTSAKHEGEIVFLIKPFINDFQRWILFKFGQDESGNDVIVIIISAHKDENIYGER